MDSFFPKCFSLSKLKGEQNGVFSNDIEEFNEEYRFIYSASILRKYVAAAGIKDHLVPKILVSLNICEKRLLTIDEQINQFDECNGELCSETEWKILELTKKQLTKEKLKEINDKGWFKILKNQYVSLFNVEKEGDFPKLLLFTQKILDKLKK